MLLLIGAGPLYAIMLEDGLEALRGDISMGSAFEFLLTSVALWAALSVLLLIAAVRGSMPRWAATANLAVVPLACLSSILAANLYWEPHRWPIVVPAVLPVLIAAYATWARFPRWHKALAPRATSVAALCLVVGVSAVPLGLFCFHYYKVSNQTPGEGTLVGRILRAQSVP